MTARRQLLAVVGVVVALAVLVGVLLVQADHRPAATNVQTTSGTTVPGPMVEHTTMTPDVTMPTTTTVPPTTTSTAPPARPVVFTGSVPDIIRSVFARFGADVAEEAVRVSQCETGGTFDPRSTGAAGERGPMQVHPVHRDRVERMGFTWDQMYEPGPNAEVAAALYAEAGWQPWSCRSAA